MLQCHPGKECEQRKKEEEEEEEEEKKKKKKKKKKGGKEKKTNIDTLAFERKWTDLQLRKSGKNR